MGSIQRIEPDKAAYQEELGSFIRTTVANYPRTDASTKIKLTTQANLQFTRQYGVEVNLLMTKLFGVQRTQFGFDQDPELKHFALKIYGKVYEFGPYPEKVRKTLFLDWCADNLAFEFATKSNVEIASGDNLVTGSNNKEENRNFTYRQPVTTYTMKFEYEMDEWVKEYSEKTAPYDLKSNNCLKFVIAALEFLYPKPSTDSEMQSWLRKYLQESKQSSKKTNVVQIQRVESTTSTPSSSPMDIPGMELEPVDDEEIECVNLVSDDESYELCEL